MLKSVIISAIRNILRNRTFSLINLVGFSVSMSVCLLIIMVVHEQYTYDNFHNDAEQIYRINTRALRTEGGEEPYASVPFPLGKALEDYTFSDQVIRINRHLRGDAIYGNVNVPIAGLLIDPSFLETFNFPLEKGNPASALIRPNSLVITQETAIKLFGDQEALGKTISIGSYGEFVVTGVLKKFSGKTHFEFEVLGSTSSLPLFEKEGKVSPTIDNWNNYYGSYVYVKLKPGREVSEVESALRDIATKQYVNLKLETRDKGYEFFPLRLSDITPGPMLSNQMGTGMPALLVVFLGVLVAIIMIMACFNYTNLMIAKSLTRAREIGIRKIVGAARTQVFFQFVGEAIIFSLISLFFSYLLLQVLRPAFLHLNMAQEFATQLNESYSVYFYFVIFAMAVGLMAGLLPAGYLSAFRPASVLKAAGNLKSHGRLTLRKSLIVAQFTVSLSFIILVLVIYNQVDYMINKNYGFEDRDVLNVHMYGSEFEKLANEIRSVQGVKRVGGVSHQLGTWQDRSSDYKVSTEDKPFVMRDFMMDDNYITNLGLTFVAGNNFDPALQGKMERHVILNEKALERFGFDDPISAIGKSIVVEDSVILSVIGVVKDFHFRPMNYEIGPLALRYNLNELSYLSLKIEPTEWKEVVSALTVLWKRLDPVHPLEYKMMSEEIDAAYTDSGLVDVLKIVGYMAFIAISLACMGMLGMAMYATQTRTKEIGVRKVMGASAYEVVILLSRSFLLLIGISGFMGMPLGYFMANLFLDNYPYKIPVSPLILLSGVLIMLFLSLLTISSQTWSAAERNPVDSLRHE